MISHPWENGCSVAWGVLISPKWVGRCKEITSRLLQNQFPGRKLPFPSWQLISFSILLKMLAQVDPSYIRFIFSPILIEVVIEESFPSFHWFSVTLKNKTCWFLICLHSSWFNRTFYLLFPSPFQKRNKEILPTVNYLCFFFPSNKSANVQWIPASCKSLYVDCESSVIKAPSGLSWNQEGEFPGRFVPRMCSSGVCGEGKRLPLSLWAIPWILFPNPYLF